ncbi:MAG: hypothetical protein ABIC36_03490 [bacterium]
MSSKRKLVKELEKLSKKFIDPKQRKNLLGSLRGDKTQWFLWVSQIKGILKNIDKVEAVKFSGLLLVLEQKSNSRFCQDNLKKFLISKTEFYKHYDFALEKQLSKRGSDTKKLWTSKILRLFISKSFLGILILVLALGFVLWFYVDRENCLEFVDKVIQPFFKAIR